MCGRFVITDPNEAIAALFDAVPGNDLPDVPRFNVCPTQPVAVVTSDGGARRLQMAAALRVGDGGQRRVMAELRLGRRIDGDHAGDGQCRGAVDRIEARMGVRAAQEDRDQRARRPSVAGIAPAAGQQPWIFQPPQRHTQPGENVECHGGSIDQAAFSVSARRMWAKRPRRARKPSVS